eukprot:scaffold21991_cov33-Tisochrysis_lutea.AAC.2
MASRRICNTDRRQHNFKTPLGGNARHESKRGAVQGDQTCVVLAARGNDAMPQATTKSAGVRRAPGPTRSARLATGAAPITLTDACKANRDPTWGQGGGKQSR